MTQEARAARRKAKITSSSVPFDETPVSIAILALVTGVASTAGASTYALRGIDARRAALVDVSPGIDISKPGAAKSNVDARRNALDDGPSSANGASEGRAETEENGASESNAKPRSSGATAGAQGSTSLGQVGQVGQTNCSAIELSFAPSSTSLDPEQQKAVDLLARWLVENDDTRVLVEGHADARGRADVNLWLSHERASSVASMLASRGVARSRLVVRAFGAYQPVPFANETDERQRRVVIHVSSEHGCPPSPRVPIEP